ncbi:MAG TPA: carboxypeptidase regulatory-like domain-containing protein [Bryobacteraceae bacterium]|nr:carboxypeptidase regulatory-like domain-containing protein [Bryobacteraceae bacterium]
MRWGALTGAVAVAASLCAQVTPELEKPVFEGVVRDSVTKLPVPKASVQVIPLAEKQPGYAGVSDATGAFRFEGIVPGDYRMRTRGRGYADSRVVAIGARRKAVVQVAEHGSITGSVIELDPEAIVTGRVTNSEGEPVPAAVVFAIEEQWQRGFRVYKPVESASANDRGEYRLKVLPGRYYLSALPLFDGIVPRVFADDPDKPEVRAGVAVYPNASNIEGGSPLELRPGQELSGISFKLRNVTTYHVRGKVNLFTPAPRTVVSLNRRNGDRSPGAGNVAVDVNKDGTFDLKGVAPGSYWLELMPLRDSPTGRMPLEVTDRDVDGIHLASIPQFDVQGHVRLAEDDMDVPLTLVKLRIDWLNWYLFNFGGVSNTNADGAFIFRLRPAGEYVLTLPPDRDLYIQSVSCNQHAVEGGRLDFGRGPAGEVEVVLANGTATVEGKVEWPDAEPGAMAILVSASGATGNTGARGVELDESGHFTFRYVPPGKFYVFASGRFDEGLWQNAEFVSGIQEGATAVDVAAKGSISVEAQKLTAADFERAMQKVPR